MEEQVIQKLPRRCPYCDEVLPEKEITTGEEVEEEMCPYCGRVFVRLSLEEASRLAEEGVE
jgi:DNA-directed RNA polymerase subunit RPC12/RpoP